MLEKLEAIARRYQELSERLSDPDLLADQTEWRRVVKEHSRLEDLVATYRQLQAVEREIAGANELLQDKLEPELRELAETELADLQERAQDLRYQLRLMLLPRDPHDDKNVIVEIRGGAGGDEAGLFAAVLFRMYTRFAERQGWKTEVLESSPTEVGGFREVIFAITGDGAYSRMKYESGVHRVQRVPTTEASGRIHTSTATVAVLPEAEEVDVEIDPNDLRIDTFCSSGPGGQSVNTTYSAVRITHLPTGLVVSCQDEKSQIKNRARAMRVLRARLLDQAQQQQRQEVADARRSQVGSGDRSERIRTYNYPQNRVSDHRIGFTTHRLEAILDGDLEEIIDNLVLADQTAKLAALEA